MKLYHEIHPEIEGIMYWPKTRGRIAHKGDTGFGFWFRFGSVFLGVRFGFGQEVSVSVSVSAET